MSCELINFLHRGHMTMKHSVIGRMLVDLKHLLFLGSWMINLNVIPCIFASEFNVSNLRDFIHPSIHPPRHGPNQELYLYKENLPIYLCNVWIFKHHWWFSRRCYVSVTWTDTSSSCKNLAKTKVSFFIVCLYTDFFDAVFFKTWLSSPQALCLFTK